MTIRKVPTPDELKAILTPDQYHICCEAGTEPPFTGEYWNTKTAGTYRCRCCAAPLFRSEQKFDSGTGWPSFWQQIEDGQVVTREDRSHGMLRVEILCANCEAHLGHVFPDGPEPTGLRYCVNSASLQLQPDDAPE
jgi:peptide-methionine (R)-S-oxide reductase